MTILVGMRQFLMADMQFIFKVQLKKVRSPFPCWQEWWKLLKPLGYC